MPKLNGVQIADRLRSRLEELRSGKEVAARDLKVLLTEEQIAAMDKRLMRDSHMLKSEDGQNRTLYSLRHTYATFELLENSTDIHTLAKQMGNSAAMIERHYSKLTATMAAEKLA